MDVLWEYRSNRIHLFPVKLISSTVTVMMWRAGFQVNTYLLQHLIIFLALMHLKLYLYLSLCQPFC